MSHKSSITLACKKTANKLPSKGFGAPPPPPVDRIKASSIASTVVSDIGARDDLTLHELASRFASVLQHYSTTQTLTEEVVQRNMLATRLDDLHLARCRCAPSLVSGAGNGLFACRDIAPGELITLYPGDALLRCHNSCTFLTWLLRMCDVTHSCIYNDSFEARWKMKRTCRWDMTYSRM